MSYRENVCAVIRDGNSVFLCHRLGFDQNLGWQFPQGGIDININSDDDLVLELKRELLEEIGTDNVKIIKISPNRYKYDFPKEVINKFPKYTGQVQRWVLCEFLEHPPNINFNTTSHPEFDSFQWVTPKKAVENIVNFKQKVYRNALGNLGLL